MRECVIYVGLRMCLCEGMCERAFMSLGGREWVCHGECERVLVYVIEEVKISECMCE